MSYKVPVIIGDGFTTYVEPHKSYVLIHCDVHKKVSPSMIKEMRRRWKEWRTATKMHLFVLRTKDKDKTFDHYISMFGFSYYKKVTNKDGEPAEIWINRGR